MDVSASLDTLARLDGNLPAVICDGKTQSWAQFRDMVARFAAVLKQDGVTRGDRVAVLADNSDLYMAAFLAVPWLGAILVPLNTRLSGAELADLIALSTPRLILRDEPRGPLLAAALQGVDHPPATMLLRGDDGSMAARIEAAAPLDERVIDPNLPVSIFFTGGTTGRSKGALTTHRAHMYNSLAMWTTIGVDTSKVRYLHVPPMFHVADALFVHAVTLIGGLHVILPRFEVASVIEAIAAHKITDIYLVPTMIVTFLDELERNPRALPSLERIFYGAMPMPEALARRLLTALPHIGPVQLFGQTEAGPTITMLTGKDHDTSGRTNRLRSAGRPMPGVEIMIVDPDDREVPRGDVGEIVARSPGVMPGYWDDPEQSERTLRGGWLHTGDAGYFDEDGYLYVVDRIKDMIISGGENIYSVEVERAIALHPAVAQCAVIGVPDEAWGELVHAAVILRENATLSAEELQQHCRTLIAGYKLPRSFDWRESMPLSGPGKILKRALRDEAVAKRQARNNVPA